ncbi:hypothetical protein BDW74DRAFT_52538 [Aspergillus multicolor]|uniref:glutathione S-transferase family protein n=1 Tax=Aspergillus multicolor TaxID=41759 RepID=UPI003CCE0CB4
MSPGSRLLKKLTRKQADPCLYTYPFSVQSLVVHFAIVFALRAKQRPSRELTQLGFRLVNVDRNENLREWYLKVNPYGRVPTLTYSALPSPLTDALSIVYWICDQCPSLLPKAHQTEICRLLTQLHESLDRYGAANPTVDDLLTNHDITPTHRKALEYKRDCQRKQRELVSLNLSDGQSMTANSISFMNEIVELQDKYSKRGTWIFGDKVGPTVLDAHVVPFVTRLEDIGLEDLVPDQLRKYADRIKKLPQGKEAMGQRPTVWDASLGPIDEIRL